MDPIVLSLLWIGWCILHSLLITPAIIDTANKRLPWLARYYRLLYNLVAVLTLAPLVVATGAAGGPVVFEWLGGWNLLRAMMLAGALLLFRGGARVYDFGYLLGTRQLRTGESRLLLGDTPEFVERGVFALVRHPWYLGSLLLIWSALPAYPQAKFLAAVILSVYLIVGSLLEERKILARHRERYSDYRRRVSMLFPWKWLVRILLRPFPGSPSR